MVLNICIQLYRVYFNVTKFYKASELPKPKKPQVLKPLQGRDGFKQLNVNNLIVFLEFFYYI